MFTQENEFQNVVCEMAAILCQPQFVKKLKEKKAHFEALMHHSAGLAANPDIINHTVNKLVLIWMKNKDQRQQSKNMTTHLERDQINSVSSLNSEADSSREITRHFVLTLSAASDGLGSK